MERQHQEPTAPAGPAVRRPQPTAEPTESWVLRTGLTVSVWLLAIIATILAASGQIQFAHWAGVNDVRAYAVPAVLELVAVAFLLIGYRRARRGDSPAALWLLAAGIGAFAVYTNVSHSGRAGLVFGAASAITLILWFVKLRDDYRQFQRHTGQATRPKPKFGALWLVAPRLTTRAWVVAARRRISTVDEAVAYAEVWRAVYEDSRTARVRRLLARRTAWRAVAEASGGVWADLPRTAEIAAVNVVHRANAAASLPASAPAAVGGTPAAVGGIPAVGAMPATVGGMPANGHRGGPAVRALPGPGVADARPLSAEVRSFLDGHIGPEEYGNLEETDDTYLLWTTARALNADVEEIADDVRAWRRDVTDLVRQQASAGVRPSANGARPLANGARP